MLISLTNQDYLVVAISTRGNVICQLKSLGTKFLISRTNFNKIQAGNSMKGAFNTVEGFDLPMFMTLKF